MLDIPGQVVTEVRLVRLSVHRLTLRVGALAMSCVM